MWDTLLNAGCPSSLGTHPPLLAPWALLSTFSTLLLRSQMVEGALCQLCQLCQLGIPAVQSWHPTVGASATVPAQALPVLCIQIIPEATGYGLRSS